MPRCFAALPHARRVSRHSGVFPMAAPQWQPSQAPRAKVFNRRKRSCQRETYIPRVELLESRLTPSTFIVSTFFDTVSANPSAGPVDANGDVSLRSAIQAANAAPGNDTIILRRAFISCREMGLAKTLRPPATWTSSATFRSRTAAAAVLSSMPIISIGPLTFSPGRRCSSVA